ncbi:hypothetical protein BRAS3809_4760009 [Bradyrhizobium sp. STM 3809]|nr:hypothetical protein BRAS3809_4760009 [Bradyrhizobium sp. STM 3809]
MPGPVPGIHVVLRAPDDVDGRAFAAPKRLRPRRRDKPGHDHVERDEHITAIFKCDSPALREVEVRRRRIECLATLSRVY